MKNKSIYLFLFILFASVCGYIGFVLYDDSYMYSICYMFMCLDMLLLLAVDFVYSTYEQRTSKLYIVIYFILLSVVAIDKMMASRGVYVLSDTVCDVIHILSSLLILMPCAVMVMRNIKLINKYQVLLDILCIGVFFYYAKNMFLSIISASNLLSSITSHTLIVMVSDIVVIMILLVGMSIFRMSFAYDEIISNVFAFLIIYIVDFASVYTNAQVLSIYSTSLKLLVVVPFLIIGISVVIFSENITSTKNYDIHFINTGSSSFIILLFLLLVIIRLIFYKDKPIKIEDIIVVFITNISYLMLSLNYKNNLLEKELKSSHKKESEKLQNSIYDRNNILEKVNEELVNTIRKDILTGVYSRNYLIEVLEGYDVTYTRKDAVVFVVDIVKFKSINELANHNVGDEVLVNIAQKLQKMFPDNSIFRTDSNEFAVLIEDKVYTDDILKKIAKDIENYLNEPIYIDEFVLNIDVVVGCDKHYDDKTMFLDIFNNASYSCKQVKKSYTEGGENFQIYDEDMSKKVKRASKMEALLKNMNYDDEFIMYYQPQFSVDGKTLIGMESLLRWKSKEFNEMISPAEFIPIAESSNLIIKIVQWTIEKAMRQIKTWNEKYGTSLKMAINISPKYLSKKNFLNELEYYIKNENVNPAWVDCEITEMSAMSTGKSIINIFSAMHEMGLSISVDDFGTGYSSLSYLKDFKIDKIKIAKELVDTIATDTNEYMIVRAIVMMAQSMKIKTIAEGVEVAEQRDKLLSLGCNQIQGYFYGRPETADAFEEKYIKML